MIIPVYNVEQYIEKCLESLKNLKYDNFEAYGFKISALFDNAPSKIGLKVNGVEVYHLNEIPHMVGKYDVKIAILTVPRAFAQEVTDFLVQSGIEYIWNFTPCVLDVPNNVKVWNENLIGSFLQFTNNDEGKITQNDN